MKVGTELQLVAKTRRGRNKIKEGLGNAVVVIQESHHAHPPAVLVAPAAAPAMSSKFIRWIRLGDDPDFEITPA